MTVEDFVFNPLVGQFDVDIDRQRFSAVCTAAEAVGDFVYAFGSSEVRTVDITDFNLMPAIGVIISKGTATSCIVQFLGESGVYTGLTPHRRYFIGHDSRASLTPPSPNFAGQTVYIQTIGVALDTDKLVVRPSDVMVKRVG